MTVWQIAEMCRRRGVAEVFHPGSFIGEEIEARDWPRDEALARLGWESWVLDDVLLGLRRVERGEAVDLARVFGTSVEFWLNLQHLHDAWKGASRGGA